MSLISFSDTEPPEDIIENFLDLDLSREPADRWESLYGVLPRLTSSNSRPERETGRLENPEHLFQEELLP